MNISLRLENPAPWFNSFLVKFEIEEILALKSLSDVKTRIIWTKNKYIHDIIAFFSGFASFLSICCHASRWWHSISCYFEQWKRLKRGVNGCFQVISVRLWNFQYGGSYRARFLAKNRYTQRKPLYFENTGSASLSKIEVKK